MHDVPEGTHQEIVPQKITIRDFYSHVDVCYQLY